ncbi:MAG: glycine-rich protein, partial [Saprospiraceae bacterium]|nr:glycine-rich protein [Saprospiraceae bacterium]
MQKLKKGTTKSAFNASPKNISKTILNLIFTFLVFCITFGDTLGQGCLPAPVPFIESFSSGVIPNGVGGSNCWTSSVTSGDGWRFTGNPGYSVANNGRSAGTYAWIDFSSTDVGVILQVQDIMVLGLSNPTLTFDYYSDADPAFGSNTPNQMYVEVLDQIGSWNVIASYTSQTVGWETQTVSLAGLGIFGVVSIRFRGESGGASNDYYNDLLLDNVSIADAIGGGCLTTYGTDVQQHCDSYVWIDGNTYTSSSNSATHILTNVAGCDSVVTLDLTIDYSTSSSTTETACDSYTWPLDGNTYTSSGTYTYSSSGGGSGPGTSQTYNYTGSVQTYTVPAGVTSINVEAWGAEGSGNEGEGGYVSADLSVTPGEVLEIYVGGQGVGSTAGYNGGGQGGSSTIGQGGAGGGASDVRRGSYTLNDRIIVAGGGGGTAGNCGNNTAEGGHGGGLVGMSGCVFSCSNCQYTGAGGTQTSGGIAGPTSHGSCSGNNNGGFGYGGS